MLGSEVRPRLLTWDEYADRWANLHGGVDPRDSAPMMRGWLRFSYRLGCALGRVRIGPGVVTAAGLVLSALAPVLAARGGAWPMAAGVVVLLAAVADSADGAVALVTSRVSAHGYVYDSVCDRLAEAAWLVALWFVGVPGWLAVLCGALAWAHEYLRARAALAGMRGVGTVTVSERPTRVAFSVAALVLGGATGLIRTPLAAGTATAIVAVWALVSIVGFTQLLAAVHEALRDGE
ncbi:MAG TPA: CDP-alcohol phosphatidyltransferase family protein [Micromonosporaceae bacterium]